MKIWKRYLAGVISILLLIGLTACAGKNEQKNAKTTETHGENIFVDSAGREVELPENIEKIAPSGVVAQVMLYSLCPDMLCGLAMDFPYYANDFVEEKYKELPVFGQLYGNNANLNMEALMNAEPDILIDMGEKKDTIKKDLDEVQEQLGIPVIFIEATLEDIPQAYEILGELGIQPNRAKELADYCKATLDYAEQKTKTISEKDKKTVYMAMGNDGLTTTVKNSIHADVLEKIGVENIVSPETLSGRTGNISFEQLLMWQPDYILTESYQAYKTMKEDSLWKQLDAVKNGRVYIIPYNPYSFLNSPPSVNRMMGVWWLGSLIYPEVYSDNLNDKVKEFYDLFYHIKLTDEQCQDILEVS